MGFHSRGGRGVNAADAEKKNGNCTMVIIQPPRSPRNRCVRREKKIASTDFGFVPPIGCGATVISDSIYRGLIVRMGFHSRGGRGVNAADAEKKNGNCTLVKIPPPRSLRNRCGRREKKNYSTVIGFIPPIDYCTTVISDLIYRGRIVRMGFHSRGGRGVNAADAEKKNSVLSLVIVSSLNLYLDKPFNKNILITN